MIRYVLVDDNERTLLHVKRKIDAISDLYDLTCVGTYENPIKASMELLNKDFDVLIVDYEMPEMNGIELAKKIRGDKKIIFLTSTSGNEKEMMNTLDISGFLSKPFDVDAFKVILKEKIIGKFNQNQKQTHINIIVSRTRDIKFKPEDVFYVSTAKVGESDKPKKNHVNFYGFKDELLYENVRITIKDLNERLHPYNFEKISGNTIINLEYLKERYNNIHILLHNSEVKFELKIESKKKFISRIRNIFN